jgi:hypothetical protein
MFIAAILLSLLTLLYYFKSSVFQLIVRFILSKAAKTADVSFQSVRIQTIWPLHVVFQKLHIGIAPPTQGNATTTNDVKQIPSAPKPLTFVSWLPSIRLTACDTNVQFGGNKCTVANIELSSVASKNIKVTTNLLVEGITLAHASPNHHTLHIDDLKIETLLSPQASLPLSILLQIGIIKSTAKVHSNCTATTTHGGLTVQTQFLPLVGAAIEYNRSFLVSGVVEVKQRGHWRNIYV